MAGTSPDRSKRYESSTGSTSGNEAPVPESGALPNQSSGSPEPAPDPRLSLSRESDPEPDQATAVFSRRALLEAAKAEGLDLDLDETQTPAAKRGAFEGPQSAGVGGGTGAAGAEAAGSQSAGSEAAESDAGPDTGSGDGEASEKAAEGSDDASNDSTEAQAHTTDGDDEEGAADDDGADADAATDADTGADDAEAGGDADAADAGADDAEAGAGAAADTDAADTDAVDADADVDADTADDDGADSADAEDGSSTGGGESVGTEPEVGAEVEGGDAGRRKGGAATPPTPAASAARQPAVGADEDGSPQDEAARQAAPAAEPETTAPAAEPETTAPAPDASADACPGSESEGEGGAEAEPVVDQPTAIFRAPRPPAVDQPTTMLKLGGGAAKPADADEDSKGREVDPEAKADDSDATPPVERTSKFVALKPLDEPTPPKPPAAAPDKPATSPAEATRAIPQIGPERTTQQPLPPKPPLDLLAELTNTPPPAQTPVRTIVRRVKIWTPLVALLAILFAVAQAVRPLPAPTLALTAEDSYAFKGDKVSLPWPDEGQGWMDVNGIGTLDSFGEQKPVAIGSVAKAMTAYVILKDHPMKPGQKGETITVDAKGETEGGYDKDGESTLNTVKEGDKLTQYDAIAAIMIPSANNIARLLARWDSNGSEEAFVKKMNAAAKDLGMTNTTYTDPSGLKETTVSTAEDQVKLGNALVRMKALTDITKLPTWVDPSGRKWDNYNRLVPYDNAIGIKTGSTTAAGGNLLFAATKEVGGETAIVVGAVLGQHTPPIIDTVNAVSKTAMLAAQDALTSDTVLKKGAVVGHVDDQLGGRTPVVVTEDVSAVGWAGKTVKFELDAGESIPHEAKAGTKVGSLIVGDGSGHGVEVPVALQNDLAEPGFGARLTRVS